MNLFFNEYKNEVIRHFDYEEVTVFPYISNMVKGARPGDYEIGVFRENHSNIDDKLNDLKNIIMNICREILCRICVSGYYSGSLPWKRI